MRRAQAGSLASTGRKGLKKAETEQNQIHYFKVSFLKVKTGVLYSHPVYLEFCLISPSLPLGVQESHLTTVLPECCVSAVCFAVVSWELV